MDILSAAKNVPQVGVHFFAADPKDCSFWHYKLSVDIRRISLKLPSNGSAVVEIYEFAVFPLVYLRNFRK